MHLDGARLWNAHVATGTPLRELADGFDTVSVCLSKGLGAPVGSVLVSTAERIAAGPGVAQALRRRHAAGRHPRRGRPATRSTTTSTGSPTTTPAPRRLADALGVDPGTCPTNIVVLQVPDAAGSRGGGARRGVLVSALGPRVLRLVTHLDVDDDGIDRAIEVLAPLVAAHRA